MKDRRGLHAVRRSGYATSWRSRFALLLPPPEEFVHEQPVPAALAGREEQEALLLADQDLDHGIFEKRFRVGDLDVDDVLVRGLEDDELAGVGSG